MTIESYNFLELLSESEAVAAGFNLSERNNFAIYQTIKKLSTKNNAKTNQLYSLKSQVSATSSIDERTIKHVLKNLISANIVAQIFSLEYKHQDGEGLLICTPCFIAINDANENSFREIFTHAVMAMIEAINHYIQSMLTPDFEEIWKELVADLNKDDSKEVYANSIIDLKKIIQIKYFDILPSLEMINMSLKEIEAGLIQNERIIHLPGFGIIPIRDNNLLERFETTETFFIDKVIPYYLQSSGLRPALAEIAQEEAIYYIEEDAVRTTAFSKRKANAILEFLKSNPDQDTHSTHPGQLTLQIIIQFADKVNRKYNETWQSSILAKVDEIKEPLLNKSSHWHSQILYINSEQKKSISKPVLDKILNDSELINGEWEQKDTTTIIVIRKDPDLLRTLIREMIVLPAWENWKILAVRQIIENHDDVFHFLFKEADFKRNYGRLLRLVYINHVPFFYRIFMFLGITIFQNKSFQIAKQKIQERQIFLNIKNLDRHNKNIRDKELIRLNKIDKIQNLAKINTIKHKLDQFYFTRHSIPSIREIQNTTVNINITNWPAWLREHGFQIIRSGNFEAKEISILCYPQDSEWYSKHKKLNELLENILGEKPRIEKDAANDLIFKRAQRLQKYLQRPQASRLITQTKTDPYLKLEHEIKKQKSKESRLSIQSDLEELDV